MKIIVPVKRVVDANVRVFVNEDNSDINTTNIKMSMNPFCAIALEQAVRIREAGTASEVVAVTVGDASCLDVLRTALAIGADRAIHVRADQAIQPLGIAKILKAIAERESPQLILLGKQAIDQDNNQTGQMLAGLLGWPQGTFASSIVLGQARVRVTREIDGGLETVMLQLPAIITADLRLNEPRYTSLVDVVRAKKKSIETMQAENLNVDMTASLRILKLEQAVRKPAGIIVSDVQELVGKLRDEARVI